VKAMRRIPTRYLTRVLLAAILSMATGLVVLGWAGAAHGIGDQGPPTCQFTSAVEGNTTTLDLSYTGSGCTWTPPSGITSATFTLYGAAGGPGVADTDGNFDSGGTPGAGGLGAEVSGTLSGISGTTFEVNVGGGGANTSSEQVSQEQDVRKDLQTGTDSFNGGGTGTTFGGDGGGGTDIRVGAFGAADRVFVAGGGGGGGSPQNSTAGGNGGDAGEDGGPGLGNDECTPDDGDQLAQGGYSGDPGPNQGAGGEAGDGSNCGGYAGSAGLSGNAEGGGGSGSPVTGAYGDGGGGGGGGGGGYFGGGGGGSGGATDSDVGEYQSDAGGGGGSSYTGGADGVIPTNSSITDPVSPGAPNGYVIINYTIAAATTTSSTSTTTTTTAPKTTTTTTTTTVAPTTTTTTVAQQAAALAVTGDDLWVPAVSGSCFLLAGLLVVIATANEIRRRRSGAR